MEIERKFIPVGLPFDINAYPCQAIEQAYISAEPVIRIRRKKTLSGEEKAPRYILTVKSSGMMSRQEFELILTAKEYDNLKKKVSGNTISKRRYVIPLGEDLFLELDIFDGIFDGLVIAEIEFPNEEAANKYTPPAYLAKEVTYDTRFHNSTLSLMTSGEISDLISWVHKYN